VWDGLRPAELTRRADSTRRAELTPRADPARPDGRLQKKGIVAGWHCISYGIIL
jgi:hypothetical protein